MSACLRSPARMPLRPPPARACRTWGLALTLACLPFTFPAPAQAAPLGEAIVADVEAFCAGLAQRDDICLICFHRQNS